MANRIESAEAVSSPKSHGYEPSNVFSEYLSATYDGAIGKPVESIKQLAGDNSTATSQQQSELHGGMKVAQTLGVVTGQFIDLAVLSKVTGGLLHSTGATKLIGEGTLYKTASAASVGFIHGALLSPVNQGCGEGLDRRLTNGIIEATAFGTVGGTASKLETVMPSTLLGKIETNALAGAAGGSVQGILDPLSRDEVPTFKNVAESAGSWAIGSAVVGLHEPLFKLAAGRFGQPESAASDAAATERTFNPNEKLQGRVPRNVMDGDYYLRSYTVKGNDFKLHSDIGTFKNLPTHFKLPDGRGVLIDGPGNYRETGRIVDMPDHIDKIGDFEYTPKSTILTNRHGRFEYDLYTKSLEYTPPEGGDRVKFSSPERYSIRRDDGFDVSFENGRATYASQQGLAWSFGKDGSMSMRSQPSGKYKINIDAEGNGSYRELTGSSRSIAGMVPGTRFKPLEGSVDAITYKPGDTEIAGWKIPDRTPINQILFARLELMKAVLHQVSFPEVESGKKH